MLVDRAAVRTPAEIEKMRRAGRVVAEMHAAIREELRPGITTAELDRVAREVLDHHGATSNFLGYHGYPAVICASPNDLIIHGIPDDTPLESGDLLSIDCGAVVDGWHGDAAFTAPVGEVSAEARELLEVAEAALDAGIAELRPSRRLGDVGHAIQQVVEAAGFSVVEEYTGHGIGREMHEEPAVPNYGRAGRGQKIRAGNVFALEPMVNRGAAETFLLEDGWSVCTADGSLSVHVEHTVAVTEGGPEILTRL